MVNSRSWNAVSSPFAKIAGPDFKPIREAIVIHDILDFLEAAESNADFRAEIPAFVAKIKEIFERWQLAQYLETARETEPFDPDLFKPRWHPLLGEEEDGVDAEEIEDIRKDDIRQCNW